jgi:hypothetical protein
MATTGRRLAVLLAVFVVSAAGLSACAGSPSASVPRAVATQVPAPAQGGGSTSPSSDADFARLEELGSTARDVTPAELEQLPPLEQARLLAPCAELSWGAFYCLGLGFRDDPPDYEALLASARAAVAGDLPFPNWLGDRVAMPLDARLAEQAAEVDGAILGLDKARSIAGRRPAASLPTTRSPAQKRH